MTTKIDGMGLFGWLNSATVKNLTVDNFSCDGEFTPTGVIAAYAVNSTFENIAVTNCNPGVYNTGNGGIVGIGGNSDDEKFFKNHRPISGGDFFVAARRCFSVKAKKLYRQKGNCVLQYLGGVYAPVGALPLHEKSDTERIVL